ncbi:MAG: hypothetical protein FJW40_09725 [Acidobacteria bacterium]|nr:hypothetical protein [Acidobacteriota bacterium]
MASRREFLLQGAAAAGLDLSGIPNFCTHEHWGSISAIGTVPEGYRADVEQGAVPSRSARLDDVLLDPYLRGWLSAAGVRVETGARSWLTRRKLDRDLERQRLSGAYQCVRRGVLKLHQVDIDTAGERDMDALDARIGQRYGNVFSWYRQAMKLAGFSELIRPVHPEFYERVASREAAAEERAFTRTVLRIDPFLGLWTGKSERRDALARIVGVEPADARTWRQFLEAWFQRAKDGGAVGTKQLQAYRRPLLFDVRDDTAVRWRGALDATEVRVFQDWVVHECSRLAAELGWVHQVHVGTHNLAESSPVPLGTLAQRYPKMRLVMIHCWPFLREAGQLAKQTPNIYLDTCWQCILNPEFLREALSLWLNYVPRHKITLGHDATSVEMAVGSSLFTREILQDSLRRFGMGWSVRDRRAFAADLLHNNAVELYGYGRRV